MADPEHLRQLPRTPKTQGVAVAGDDHPIAALSIGTRDQLALILRLSLAEVLGSPLLLDDQLTQSDREKLTWLRRLLQKVAASTQIIVLTCRPEDYLEENTSNCVRVIRKQLWQTLDRLSRLSLACLFELPKESLPAFPLCLNFLELILSLEVVSLYQFFPSATRMQQDSFAYRDGFEGGHNITINCVAQIKPIIKCADKVFRFGKGQQSSPALRDSA